MFIQRLLRRESGDAPAPIECCPSVTEWVQQVGGKTRQGRYVELYRDGNNRQTFYEYSCISTEIAEGCRAMNPGIANRTKCVQKYAYGLALVRNIESSTVAYEVGWIGEKRAFVKLLSFWHTFFALAWKTSQKIEFDTFARKIGLPCTRMQCFTPVEINLFSHLYRKRLFWGFKHGTDVIWKNQLFWVFFFNITALHNFPY